MQLLILLSILTLVFGEYTLSFGRLEEGIEKVSPGFAIDFTVLLKAVHKGQLHSAAKVQAQIDSCADCIIAYVGMVGELDSITEDKNVALERILHSYQSRDELERIVPVIARFIRTKKQELTALNATVLLPFVDMSIINVVGNYMLARGEHVIRENGEVFPNPATFSSVKEDTLDYVFEVKSDADRLVLNNVFCYAILNGGIVSTDGTVLDFDKKLTEKV